MQKFLWALFFIALAYDITRQLTHKEPVDTNSTGNDLTNSKSDMNLDLDLSLNDEENIQNNTKKPFEKIQQYSQPVEK